MARANSIIIRTPEGITFSLLLAGPAPRLMAWIVDMACVMAISKVAQMFLSSIGILSGDFATAVMILAQFAISVGYGILLETYWRGQTFGKKILRLRVMDEQGLRLQFSQVAVRNLLRIVDALPGAYMVGGLACLLSRKSQRVGDFAANTIVVRHPKLFVPQLDHATTGKFNSFRGYPHLVGRLRQRVSPEEAGLALQALLRRDRLDPAARVELFKDIADLLRSRLTFPQEATEGLSDEQYIRNVVDILF